MIENTKKIAPPPQHYAINKRPQLTVTPLAKASGGALRLLR